MELKVFLLNRNYPEKLVDTGIQKAKSINKQELRTQRPKTKESVLPYVSTFNPKNPEAFQVIQSVLPILQADEHMNNILQNNTVIKSKRQSKSLKKLLTKAKFGPTNNAIPKVRKCGRPNCGTCFYIQEKTVFEFKNNMKFTIKYDMDCSCQAVVYVITCNGCNEHYIGQTGDFRKRVTVHKQQIRHLEYSQIPLSGHIKNCAKDKNPQFYIFPFYKFYNASTETERLLKEKRFIEIFKPKLNAI